MESERPSQHIEGLPAPLSELPWSASFVMQAIEILPVALRERQLLSLRPEHAGSFVVGWPAGARPEEVAARAMQELGLEPLVLHSTSWRHVGAEVVLTYLTVVSPVAGLPPSWEAAPIIHVELARGDATTPPSAIGVLQVLEHTLRHLAWLLGDDPAIAGALPDWREALADYVPEPFRAFAGPVSQP
ncbi:MAG: hypothetical protein EXR60_00070 [Dehalococcoidia bacterium]|nr:hypothetical protein [Dehalococcoidia bacterium]